MITFFALAKGNDLGNKSQSETIAFFLLAPQSLSRAIAAAILTLLFLRTLPAL